MMESVYSILTLSLRCFDTLFGSQEKPREGLEARTALQDNPDVEDMLGLLGKRVERA